MTSAVFLGLAWLGQSEASFITYTETVMASGSLGTSTFVNAQVVVTATADTNNVVLTPGISYSVQPLVTITVANVGTATVTDYIVLFDFAVASGGATIVFGDGTYGNQLIGMYNSAFVNYDLKSSIGPLSGATNNLHLGFNYGTTAGSFAFTSVSATATFSATLGSPAVPEPASIGMMGLGVAVAASWAFSRARRVQADRF